jgi:hypothetical protein
MTFLDFSLPHFFRHAWTSDRARRHWEPRIHAVAIAVSEIQWLTVANGIRQCGIVRLNTRELRIKRGDFKERGLNLTLIGREPCVGKSATSPHVPDKLVRHYIALGKRDAAHELAREVRVDNHKAVGALLGYPDCCVESFLSKKDIDRTWSMAQAATSGSVVLQDRGGTIEISKPSLANIMLRALGLHAVFHVPCRFDCPKSIECAEQMIGIGCKEGFELEMEWLCEVLSWPIEWNALHGIAEIKTPILKCSESTDATATLHRILVEGTTFPAEGAKGIGHAYEHSGKRRAEMHLPRHARAE